MLTPDYFVFISEDHQNVIVTYKDFYQQNILGPSAAAADASGSWINFFWYQAQDSGDYNYSLRTVADPRVPLENFPLFLNKYFEVNSRNKVELFLASLPWNEHRERYLQHFHAALQSRFYAIKLTGIENTVQLQRVFEDLWGASDKERDILLAEPHLQQILQVYEPAFGTDLNTQPSIQARLLLSLAMLFARYSSTYGFGTGEDSPSPLRTYALALLNTAYALDPHLPVLSPSLIDDWRDRLIGRDEQNQAAFCCTAVLYEKMLEAVKAGMTYDPTLRACSKSF